MTPCPSPLFTSLLLEFRAFCLTTNIWDTQKQFSHSPSVYKGWRGGVKTLVSLKAINGATGLLVMAKRLWNWCFELLVFRPFYVKLRTEVVRGRYDISSLLQRRKQEVVCVRVYARLLSFCQRKLHSQRIKCPVLRKQLENYSSLILIHMTNQNSWKMDKRLFYKVVIENK